MRFGAAHFESASSAEIRKLMVVDPAKVKDLLGKIMDVLR
jgi:predicted site-specific integrase-resolvase